MFDVQAVTSFEFSQEDLALPKAVAEEITNSISAIQGKIPNHLICIYCCK